MSQNETPFNDFHAPTYYAAPDTSDRDPDETWVEYWDRKRHERHGPDCGCLLCANEDLLKEMGKSILPEDMRGWVE